MEPNNSSRLPSEVTSKILCRYFISGACREKDNCRFSHSFLDRPSTVCTYYQIGACSYGAGCRYDHVMLNNAPQQPTTTTQQHPMVAPPHPARSIMQPPNHAPFPLRIPPRRIGVPPPIASHMTTLSKCRTVSADPPHPPSEMDLPIQGLPPKLKVDDWVRAAEFVPGQKWQALSGPLSYSAAVQTGIPPSPDAVEQDLCNHAEPTISLCPYAAHGNCPYGGDCAYVHGNICEFCEKAILVPNDEVQNKKHTEECIKEHERNMEAAFAAQLSEEKTCGICHEVVWEKQSVAGRRFGILSDCSHVFCLACIRQWRSADQYESEVVRSCPECRVKSDFVIPSKYWVEGKDEKIRLIDNYKLALSKKPCMHFQQGNGKCPFNNSCFYEHAYPDGRKASPQPLRKFHNAEGAVLVDRDPSLWDFLAAENERRSELANFLISDANDDELFHLDSLQLHELPAEESPADNADEMPAGILPANELPAEKMPVEELPVKKLPANESPAEKMPVEELPVGKLPVKELPANELPAEELPAEKSPAKELPVNELSAEEEEEDTAVATAKVAGE